MNKLEIAQDINYEGLVVRTISVDEKLDIKVGDEYKFFHEIESWSGEHVKRDFIPESDDVITYVFRCEGVKGHQVDYENEEECEVLDAWNCEDEGEVLLIESQHRFIIKDVANDSDFDEMGYYAVTLEEV